VFSGVNNYTRAGDFQLNSSGNLVNGAGYYLMGIPLDPQTGNPVGSSPEVLKFTNDFVPAQATTAISYQANLPSKPNSGLLVGTDFQANPLAGAPPAATIVGSGAKLSPDAAATLTGTVSTTTGATLASLGISSGQTITINDGINSPVFSYTSTGTDHVSDLLAAINAAHTGGTLDVTGALSGGASGNVVLTGTNGIASITVAGTASADSAIGFGAGANSAQPTNLITQGAVAPGDTMTISVNGTPTTITFGTTGSDVATLAQLQSAIGAISGMTGTVNTSNGNVSMTSSNSIVLDSTPRRCCRNSASPKMLLTRPLTRSSPTTPPPSPRSRSMAVRSPPMTPRAIRSMSSFVGRKPAPVPGSCSIKATRTRPARSRCGRTSARCSISIRTVNSRPRFPV
jgi:flagellar hook protein FlgE